MTRHVLSIVHDIVPRLPLSLTLLGSIPARKRDKRYRCRVETCFTLRRALSHGVEKNRADWFHKPTFERAIKITGGQLIILLRNHNVNLTHFVNTNTNASAAALRVLKRTSTFIARPNEILRSSFIKAI